MDPTTAIDAIRREVRDTTRGGKPARVLVAERSYPSPAADVWDALTNPDRIPRWLLPISGDLRLGGPTSSRATPPARSKRATRPATSASRGSTRERSAGSTSTSADDGRRTRRCGSSTSPSSTTSPTDGTSSGRARSASAGTSPCSVSPNTWPRARSVNPDPTDAGRGRVHAPQQRRLVSGVDRLRHSARRSPRRPPPAPPPPTPGRLMHAFDVLGDPVRRRILELLVDAELTSGAISDDRSRRVRDLPTGSVAAPPRASRVRLRPRPRRRRPPPLRGRRRRRCTTSTPGWRRSAGSGSNASTPSAPRSPAAAVDADDGRSGRPAARRRRGRPAGRSIQIRPPWASTRPRAMARPEAGPARRPGRGSDRPGRSGRRRRPRNSAGNPGPSSTTRTDGVPARPTRPPPRTVLPAARGGWRCRRGCGSPGRERSGCR